MVISLSEVMLADREWLLVVFEALTAWIEGRRRRRFFPL